jgi:hypothetical protein
MSTRTVENLLADTRNLLKRLEHQMNLDDAFVYVAGSVLEGFGNPTSDVDVYIVHPDGRAPHLTSGESDAASFFEEDGRIVANFIQDGTRYDVELWPRSDFDHAVESLRRIRQEDGLGTPEITEAEVDMLHRLRFAVPLINHSDFETFRDGLPFHALGYYQVSEHVIRFTNEVEDLRGALMGEDLGTAFFLSRRVLDRALSMYLAANGETNPGTKWRYRQLRRHVERSGDMNLMDRYLQLQSHGYDPATVRQHALETMSFSQDLTMRAQQALREESASPRLEGR